MIFKHLICYLLTGLLIVPTGWTQQKAIRPIDQSQGSEFKQALIIGNADYKHAGILRNPVNDATAISETLQQLGFEVTTITDADKRKMEQFIREFGKQLKRRKGVGLFYYAGHGMQIEGVNYLLPTDINPSNEFDVTYDAVPVGKLLGQMEVAGNGMNMVILDACRNNPFARSFRSSSRGLAQVVAPTGSFISYATAPGQVASDGDGKNGLYTEKLLKHMTTPGLTLERVFKQVRMDVQKASNSRQVPWDSSSVTGDFYFVPSVAAPPSVDTVELGDLQEQADATEKAGLEQQRLEQARLEEQRMEQARLEQQRIKTQWQQWQQRMQQDYDKVIAFEQQAIENKLKVQSWERFLSSWKDDNPYSQQDGELRSMAESRVTHWQQAPQEMTLYFDWDVFMKAPGLSTLSKSENWKTTRTSDEDPVYVGEVQDGLPNGQGTWTTPSGEKYVGEFKDGNYNGQGTSTFPNGEKYVGEWKDGLPNGQGTWTLPDGKKYVGEFKDGKRNGQGTGTFPDGRVWSGLWKDNEFLGRK